MAEKRNGLTGRDEDFNAWYNAVVIEAGLADYGPVRGTMIIKPYGWALWENIQRELDRRFKAVGVENAAFPMLIPMHYLEKEAKHIEGFAPELAVVTHGGGEALSEPVVIRPTSETIIGHTYANWIESYRDLPLLINLWNSAVRWEMRTKLFLRTSEFYWQEGHTAHETAEEAFARTRQMLDVYTDFALNEAGVPVIGGEKSENERFAGAQRTLTIEAMMGDGKALQAGTSHYFGQNFSKAFDIQYLDRENERQHCWTTSWGFSTRFVGAIIMTHGDDQGLILPPRLAPHQVVVVPIYKRDEEKSTVMEAVERVERALTAAGVRVTVDRREHVSPGYKFHHWELRGVPLRLEIGPRDVQTASAVLARRDLLGKAGKQVVAQAELVAVAQGLLAEIQANLLARATEFQAAHTQVVATYDDFKAAVKQGFAQGWWAGSNEDELRVKGETKATLRCFPLAQPGETGVCFYTGRPAQQVAIFGQAY